jgi:hypothetical protein
MKAKIAPMVELTQPQFAWCVATEGRFSPQRSQRTRREDVHRRGAEARRKTDRLKAVRR